eukprot:COSAG01_NODE_1102_length_11682_cov_11.201848_2_plen_124_part_00
MHIRALLLLGIIASLPKAQHTLENFPCWLHMLTPRGQGSSMADNSETPASVVRTVQKHTADEANRIMSAIAQHMDNGFARVRHEVASNSAQLDILVDEQSALKNQLRDLAVRLHEMENIQSRD